MNRRLTAIFAALEALLVVGVGIGIPLVPLTLMWAIQYGLTIDWIVFWRASVDVWLLGHGVDIRFTLDETVAASSGFPGAAAPFDVTIAPLAFALITALLGVRAGRRIGETPHPHVGRFAGLAVFACLSLGVAFTALSQDARPSLVQSAVLPTLVFGLGLIVGAARVRWSGFSSEGPGAAASALRRRGRQASARLGDLLEGATARALRVAMSGGVAAAALVIAVAALTVALLLGVSYAQVISLYQAVQSGFLGGAALTVGQLAFVPNLVIWAASWFTGPGFALGTGSAVSPLGTDLGPLPAIPLLGALPAGDMELAFAGLLVPVLAGFLAAAVLRPRLERAGLDGLVQRVMTGLAMGLVAGVVLGALAWVSSGSAGPGRLVEVGPSWLLVGCWASLEIGLAAAISLAVGGVRRAEPLTAPDPAAAGSGAEGSHASDLPAADPHASDPNASDPNASDLPAEGSTAADSR